MARNKLTETKVRKLDKPGIYSDGDGLYLRVRAGGSKQWVFIFKRNGKRTEEGLGGYGQGTAPVSVSLAREKADAIRERLARGEVLDARKTFLDVMDDVIKVKLSSFRNEKHKAQWRMTLDTYAKPLHKMAIADITRDDVVETLKPIWTTKPETARRTRQRIEAVINHAKARSLYVGDNPADWKGGLKELLPAEQKLTRGHHDAIDYHHISPVIASLRDAVGVSARAVEFACLTAARSGEVRGMVFDEVDFKAAVWTVPAERMKAGKEHRVPLSVQALAILQERKDAATSEVVFEGGKEGAAVSDTAMMKALRTASGGAGTLHGFRSSFRDWAGDMTAHPRDVIEAALAHTIGNATEAAYRRKDALAKRRVLMQDWANYCKSEKKEK